MSSFFNGGVRGWGDTRDEWLVKLSDCDHHPSSRVWSYILRKSVNSVSYPHSPFSPAKFDNLSSCFRRTALLVVVRHWLHRLNTILKKDNSQFHIKSFAWMKFCMNHTERIHQLISSWIKSEVDVGLCRIFRWLSAWMNFCQSLFGFCGHSTYTARIACHQTWSIWAMFWPVSSCWMIFLLCK